MPDSTAVEYIAMLERDLRGIRHDLARLHSTEYTVLSASLKDAVDFIDAALIVMEGLDNE